MTTSPARARSPASPEPSSWSAPARWAAPCWRAGWRSGSIRNPWSRSSRSRRAKLTALASRGLRLNPPAHTVGEAAAIVIAVKPQVAPEVVPTLAPYLGAAHRGALDHGRPHARAFSNRRCRSAPRWCARCRTRRPRSAAASPSRCPTSGSRSASATSSHALLVGDRRGRMDRRRSADGRGDRGLRLRARPMCSCWRRRWPAPASPPDCRRTLPAKLARATVAGSGELLHRSPLDPATLRQNVTSPGGTTAAALDVLMAPDGLDPLMREAVAAATRRSRELAG